MEAAAPAPRLRGQRDDPRALVARHAAVRRRAAELRRRVASHRRALLDDGAARLALRHPVGADPLRRGCRLVQRLHAAGRRALARRADGALPRGPVGPQLRALLLLHYDFRRRRRDRIDGVGSAWFYDNPKAAFLSIKNHLSFYPSKVNSCYIGGEQVKAQEGDFYGGWITSKIVGPFKGGPKTFGW